MGRATQLSGEEQAMLRSALLVAVGLVAGGPFARAADTTETTNQHEKKGSTKVHGKTWITEKENGTITCTIEVTTKKSGLNGSGWGCTQAVFYNSTNEVVLHFEHTQTTGA
jgi:hypothetical protein